jgi:WD40 repeat protein
MINSVWTGHSKAVRSLSWSPSSGRIASGSDDGTILIRKAESGKVAVGPFETEQEGVQVLAYSPSGELIASGGFSTICVWNAITSKLVAGPIKNLGDTVMSLVWSSDSTKLYSAAGSIARVFDSKSGELLYSFQSEHDSFLSSIALSPQQDVLACVGNNGIAQLWDTKSHQPLSQQFRREHKGWLTCVLFSRDGKYIAYSGDNGKLTLWILEDMAPPSQLSATLPQQSAQQEIRPSSSLSSCLSNVSMFISDCPSSLLTALLQADTTGGEGFIEEARDDPYHNFFQVCITYTYHARALVLTISTTSLLCNLFHRHPLAPIFSMCFQFAASQVPSLDVAHHQMSLFHMDVSSPSFSLVVLAHTRPWTLQL